MKGVLRVSPICQCCLVQSMVVVEPVGMAALRRGIVWLPRLRTRDFLLAINLQSAVDNHSRQVRGSVLEIVVFCGLTRKRNEEVRRLAA